MSSWNKSSGISVANLTLAEGFAYAYPQKATASTPQSPKADRTLCHRPVLRFTTYSGLAYFLTVESWSFNFLIYSCNAAVEESTMTFTFLNVFSMLST